MFACIYGQSIPDGVSLADFAYSFSPFVEETARHTILIDIAGCELLFGSAWEMANDIAMRAAKGREEGGLELFRIGLAAIYIVSKRGGLRGFAAPDQQRHQRHQRHDQIGDPARVLAHMAVEQHEAVVQYADDGGEWIM